MKLFIIGNGFDLYNGYKTSYLDFKDFLIDNELNYTIGESTLIDILSPEYDFEFWKDFEENLSKITLERISIGYDEKEEYSRNNRNIVEHIKDIQEELYSLIQNALSDFIAKNTEQKILPKDLFLDLFSFDDRFISFNYSVTLETVYHVASQNIHYIHGLSNFFRYEDNNDSIIFGHSGEIPDKLYTDNLYYEKDHPEYLKAQIRNSLTKYLDIYKFESFIGKVSLYEKIHIIGHSLGIVDIPYFEKLNTSGTKKIIYWQYITKNIDEKKIVTKLERLFNRVKCDIYFYDEKGIQKVVEVK